MTLLQTNSYIVPKDKRGEHARLMARFRRCFTRLGSGFEVYEQVGPNFSGDGGGRFVQIMRFRDRKHQQDVHERERGDAAAQTLIADFCRLVNLPYQQQQGLFATSFYGGVLHESVAGEATETTEDGPHDQPVAAEQEEFHDDDDAVGSGEMLGELVDTGQESDEAGVHDAGDEEFAVLDDESADDMEESAPTR